MSQSNARGGLSKTATRRDHNGFVNRRSTVQSRPPAQASNNPDFTADSARAAIDGYLAGNAPARLATAALAWQVRNPSASHTGVFVARVRDLGLNEIAARRLVNQLRAVARRIATRRVEPYAGIVESRTLALTALRQAVAS